MNHQSTKRILTCLLISLCSLTLSAAQTNNNTQDMLIKLAPHAVQQFSSQMQIMGTSQNQNLKTEVLTDQWVRVQGSPQMARQILAFKNHPDVLYVQPNYKIKLPENYKLTQAAEAASKLISEELSPMAKKNGKVKASKDNPPLPTTLPQDKVGADPDFAKQWGMNDIGVKNAWKINTGNSDMIVAVIDSGIDYTHPDLLPNLWMNTKEIPNNNIDDDNNGYVDDIIGWDFFSDDNKPYDLAVAPIELLKGGNPGHGTHCAGNVAARGNNSIGISGVAPQAKIMGLRFISDQGQGTTDGAIKAIKYAVDNGAKVLSNSWGSEGEDPADQVQNQALRDVIKYAQDHGVLFIAAAGNGHQGTGYSNDTDPNPAYPASYDIENIVSVAALDSNDQLGSFSNWGAKSVHIGAPGVVVYSTTVGGKYSDTVLDKFGFHVTWDGTSMACPHVAGAAALYWSAHPEKDWRQVKAALMNSAKPISALSGKVVTNGKLDVEALMNQ